MAFRYALYLAQKHDKPLFGVMPRRKSVILQGQSGTALCPGKLDDQLGDRRQIIIDDVAGASQDGQTFRFGIVVEEGFVRDLHARVFRAEKENVGSAISDQLRKLRLVDVWYLDPSGERRNRGRVHTVQSIIGVPPTIERPSAWQKWVLGLDSLLIQRSTRTYAAWYRRVARSWRVRRAKPATASEIRALEIRGRCHVPMELAELWQVTNGMSFLGAPMAGTYDAVVAETNGDTKQIGLMGPLYGDVGHVHVTCGALTEGRPVFGRVRLDLSTAEGPIEWSTIKRFCEWWIGERRAEGTESVL